MAEHAGRLWPFRYADLPLHGALLRLGPEWASLCAERAYDPLAAQLLGSSLCTVALLAGSAKNPPKLTMQLSGVEGLDLLVAQSLRPGALRGMVKPSSLERSPLGGQGRLVMTLETGGQAAPMQSIVPLEASSLAQAMGDYFRQSEQLPARFYLHADTQQAFGLFVQGVAGDATPVEEALQVIDQWALQELPADDPQLFLGALLEADIQLLQPQQDWVVRCHCDHASVSRMILGLGAEESRKLAAERGHIHIECGYCGQDYVFEAMEVDALFHAQEADPEPPLTH
ncbi:MAG: Hsp33 family molecular chaperone HslO [Oceanococcaceae bacterium]